MPGNRRLHLTMPLRNYCLTFEIGNIARKGHYMRRRDFLKTGAALGTVGSLMSPRLRADVRALDLNSNRRDATLLHPWIPMDGIIVVDLPQDTLRQCQPLRFDTTE